MSFPGTRRFQGGTPWKFWAHKWYAIRKSLGTAGVERMLILRKGLATVDWTGWRKMTSSKHEGALKVDLA